MAEPRINIPQKNLEAFCHKYQVHRLALFGSVLRNDFNPNSDVDVLFVFDPSARVTFMTHGRMKRELSALLQRPVDLVPQEGLKLAISETVLANAREVYAA